MVPAVAAEAVAKTHDAPAPMETEEPSARQAPPSAPTEPPDIAAAEANAEAEGLALLRSSKNSTGFKYVAPNSNFGQGTTENTLKPYRVSVPNGELGYFDSIGEAALAVARHLGPNAAPSEVAPTPTAEPPVEPLAPVGMSAERATRGSWKWSLPSEAEQWLAEERAKPPAEEVEEAEAAEEAAEEAAAPAPEEEQRTFAAEGDAPMETDDSPSPGRRRLLAVSRSTRRAGVACPFSISAASARVCRRRRRRSRSRRRTRRRWRRMSSRRRRRWRRRRQRRARRRWRRNRRPATAPARRCRRRPGCAGGDGNGSGDTGAAVGADSGRHARDR